MAIKKIRENIVAGLIVLIPIVVSFYVVYWMFKALDNFLFPFYKFFFEELLGIPISNLGFPLPGLSLILTFFVILLSGFFFRRTIGKQVISYLEVYLERIPILRELYSSIKQLTSAIFVREKGYEQVVIIEYPKEDMYVLGLLTGTELEEIQQKTNKDVVSVYVPTSPNPTSGMMVFVPKQDIIRMEMSVNQALRLIISGGFTPPREEDSEINEALP